MTWNSSKGPASPKSGGASTSRYGPEPALQRLIRFVAEEGGVHAFVHRATADQGVVEEARALTRMLLGGRDIPEPCRQLCQRLGVDESLLRARLWAVASLLPDSRHSSASPYEILGVEPWADQAAIKRAFRALCLKWHPDRNQDDPEAVTRFRQIKTAYDMLGDPAAVQGWGPPAGLNVWEEPGPGEEKRAWPRLRRLTPLAVAVGLLVLAVAFADLVTLSPRSRPASRDASWNQTAAPGMPGAAGGDAGHQGVREPLVLPGAASGQPAAATPGRPEALAAGGGGHSGAAPVTAAQDAAPALRGEAGPRDAAAPDAKDGAGDAGRTEAPAQPGTAPGRLAAAVQAPASLDDRAARSGPVPDEAAPGGRGVPGSEDRAASAGESQPAAPDGGAVQKTVEGTDRTVRGAASGQARKGGSQAPVPTPPRAQPVESPREQAAPSRGLPEPSPEDGGGAMVNLRDVEERLETFLAAYVRDYSRRDLQSFLRHFAPSAIENGAPMRNMLPRYEENFRTIPTIRYSIMVDTFSLVPGGVRFAGRFELRGSHSDGQSFASRGTLNMDLETFETTLRVRRLEYAFR